MNLELLRKHISQYQQQLTSNPDVREKDSRDRAEREAYYKSWTFERLQRMTKEEFGEYISRLWAMLIWGNKRYVVDKLIADNGFDHLRDSLANFLWGDSPIKDRWDHFRKTTSGLGPASMSELLSHTHPTEYALWNRKAYVGMRYLGVQDLPKYDYQVTGERYLGICQQAKTIAQEMQSAGIENIDLMVVDYFIWNQLQVSEDSGQVDEADASNGVENAQLDELQSEEQEFVHDEIKQKLADIGKWLGFESDTEVKVADGSKVDTTWEATIGNMGRVVYVFEVQTKGSIDSLIINLLKSLNNHAVQGVVAVSDGKQLEKIRSHAAAVKVLEGRLKYWDYTEVLQVHTSLETVNEKINKLELVPHGFGEVCK